MYVLNDGINNIISHQMAHPSLLLTASTACSVAGNLSKHLIKIG